MESAPGLALAFSITSFSEEPCEGCATRKKGIIASGVMCARSFSGWNGMLGWFWVACAVTTIGLCVVAALESKTVVVAAAKHPIQRDLATELRVGQLIACLHMGDLAEEVAEIEGSFTGQFLRGVLATLGQPRVDRGLRGACRERLLAGGVHRVRRGHR